VKTATSTSPTDVTSTSYSNFSTATATVTVPSGETGRVIAYFSAEDACFGSPATNQRCLVRITVDGTELEPAANTDAFWDNNGHAAGSPNDNDSVQSRAIVRASGTLAAGSHVVAVQAATTNSAVTLRLDDWALVVERVKL
jgi:hypothetical protein